MIMITFEQFVKLHKCEYKSKIMPFSTTIYVNLKTKKKYYSLFAFYKLLNEQFVSKLIGFKPITTEYKYIYPINKDYYILYMPQALTLTISCFTEDFRNDILKYYIDLDKDILNESDCNKIGNNIDFNLFKLKLSEFYRLYKSYIALEQLA